MLERQLQLIYCRIIIFQFKMFIFLEEISFCLFFLIIFFSNFTRIPKQGELSSPWTFTEEIFVVEFSFFAHKKKICWKNLYKMRKRNFTCVKGKWKNIAKKLRVVEKKGWKVSLSSFESLLGWHSQLQWNFSFFHFLPKWHVNVGTHKNSEKLDSSQCERDGSS